MKQNCHDQKGLLSIEFFIFGLRRDKSIFPARASNDTNGANQMPADGLAHPTRRHDKIQTSKHFWERSLIQFELWGFEHDTAFLAAT